MVFYLHLLNISILQDSLSIPHGPVMGKDLLSSESCVPIVNINKIYLHQSPTKKSLNDCYRTNNFRSISFRSFDIKNQINRACNSEASSELHRKFENHWRRSLKGSQAEIWLLSFHLLT